MLTVHSLMGLEEKDAGVEFALGIADPAKDEGGSAMGVEGGEHAALKSVFLGACIRAIKSKPDARLLQVAMQVAYEPCR